MKIAVHIFVDGNKQYSVEIALMLMGDFYQLPPIASTYTLYSAVVKMFSDSKDIEKKTIGPRSRGAQLFRSCKKFELTEQMRAAEDRSHSQMLGEPR